MRLEGDRLGGSRSGGMFAWAMYKLVSGGLEGGMALDIRFLRRYQQRNHIPQMAQITMAPAPRERQHAVTTKQVR